MPTTNSLNNQTQNSDFTVNKTTAGVGSYCVVNHLDGTNVANDAAIITQTKPGGGDSYHLTMVDGTRSMCWGMDVSDNYTLKETTFAGGTGSPSFGTTIRAMTINGEQTLPRQPAFVAHLSATDSNVTGAGGVYFLGSGNVLTIDYQQGSALSTNGTFTAPVTGVYLFSAALIINDITAAMTGLNFLFDAPAGTANYGLNGNFAAIRNTGNQLVLETTRVIYLTATQTCRVAIQLANGAGDTADIQGGAFASASQFSGCLLC